MAAQSALKANIKRWDAFLPITGVVVPYLNNCSKRSLRLLGLLRTSKRRAAPVGGLTGCTWLPSHLTNVAMWTTCLECKEWNDRSIGGGGVVDGVILGRKNRGRRKTLLHIFKTFLWNKQKSKNDFKHFTEFTELTVIASGHCAIIKL